MPRSDALLVGRAGGGAALRDDVRSGDGGDEGDGGKGGNAAHGRSPVGTAEAKRRQGTAPTSGGEPQRFGSGRAARLEPVAKCRGERKSAAQGKSESVCVCLDGWCNSKKNKTELSKIANNISCP